MFGKLSEYFGWRPPDASMKVTKIEKVTEDPVRGEEHAVPDSGGVKAGLDEVELGKKREEPETYGPNGKMRK